MNRWFRFYNDALRNPKVASLSDKDFRTWVSLLAIANENDGQIPGLDSLKHLLMMRLDHLSSALDRLAKAGLIDALGTSYEPHNWDKFQYKSDTSTARVTLHRKRSQTVTETPPDTDTDTDTDILLSNDNSADGFLPFDAPVKTKTSVSVGAAVEVDPDKIFWGNAKSYLGSAKSSLIGRWIKDHGREAVAGAIAAAQVERAVSPVEYIEGVFRKRRGGGGSNAPANPDIPI